MLVDPGRFMELRFFDLGFVEPWGEGGGADPSAIGRPDGFLASGDLDSAPAPPSLRRFRFLVRGVSGGAEEAVVGSVPAEAVTIPRTADSTLLLRGESLLGTPGAERGTLWDCPGAAGIRLARCDSVDGRVAVAAAAAAIVSAAESETARTDASALLACAGGLCLGVAAAAARPPFSSSGSAIATVSSHRLCVSSSASFSDTSLSRAAVMSLRCRAVRAEDAWDSRDATRPSTVCIKVASCHCD